MKTSSNFSPIRGVSADGTEVWFTGRAGDLFVSANKADALLACSLEGARRKALSLNAASALHGIRFVAVCAE